MGRRSRLLLDTLASEVEAALQAVAEQEAKLARFDQAATKLEISPMSLNRLIQRGILRSEGESGLPQVIPQGDLSRKKVIPAVKQTSGPNAIQGAIPMQTSPRMSDAANPGQACQPSRWWRRREIAGCRAIVTGASSGIGHALARELARHGADLVLSARRRERLEALAGEIQAGGRRVAIVAGDLTDAGVRQAVLEAADQELGGLDVLVNNAGVAALGRFEDANPDRLRQILEVNFFSLVELTRAALPRLKQGRRPIVVNVGSILGHVAIPHLSEYCAAKFAVRGFSDALRAELQTRGVDVLLVSPATVETEIWERMLEQTAPTAWRSPRGLSPQAVAVATVRAIRGNRREVLPGLEAKAFHLVNRLCPSLVAWVLARRH